MPVPVCFMVMPYRTRDTNLPPPAPARVNCDALWEKALRPAIEGLGYEAVRADQDLGALIIQGMLERLYFSDLVIADMTLPNGNVYYEVGIRHAAKEAGCVLIGADWSRALFDVDQMRQVRYPLPEGEINDDTAIAIRDAITNAIPKRASERSPMFESLEGFPDVKPDSFATNKRFLDDLVKFQAEARAVRLASEGRRERALALRQKYASTHPMSPSVGLEVLYVLRDCASWDDTLDYIRFLREPLASLPVVREQEFLALSKLGHQLEAIAGLELLIASAGETSERLGLIGGRYKKLFADAKDDLKREMYLDRAIDFYERAMNRDLNDYFPSSNLPRLYRERRSSGDEEKARVATAVASTAAGRAYRLNPADEWVRPTFLGLAFDAGDVQRVNDVLREVIREGPAAWKLQTTLDDLRISIRQQQDPAIRKELEARMSKLERL
jgi:hypothetical protein